jgi:AraC-like DNA-binding protein
VSLNDVADKVHLAATYLSNLLKQETGKSFKQLLDELRLEHSKNLLWYTDMTPQQIALASGFLDQPHFAKRFKAYMSLTPGQFRKQHRTSVVELADLGRGEAKRGARVHARPPASA